MKKLIYALIVTLVFSTFGSASAAFPGGLVAFYTFNGTPNDSSGVSEPISLENAPFTEGQVLYLNGEYFYSVDPGYLALAQISRFYYDQFTVSTDFHALVFDIAEGKDTLIIGGSSYRWFGLRYRNDELQLTLNNQRFVHTLAGVHLQVGRWYNISASFDLQAKTVVVMLDGELVGTIKLDSEFTLDVIGSASDPSDRNFTYTNYSYGGVFHGYVDNLIVFNRALSTDEMRDLYSELSFSLVPDLVGQSQSAAEAMLVAAHLSVGVVTYQASESVSVGQVISQSPLAGTLIATGSTVDLVVSSGPAPAPATVPNVVNQTLSQAEAALTAAGLALGSVTSQHHATIASGRVISQSVPASSQVAQGTAVNLVISNGPVPLPPRLVVSPNDGYPVLLDSGDATPHPVSQTYLLRNPGGTAFDYQISTTAPWLDLSQTRGRLEVGAETRVTVSANAQVNTLAQNQVHEAEVRFDNLSDGMDNTVRSASAFVLADSGTGWSVSTTEGFDDNSSLAAVDIPPNTTAVLRFLVDIPVTQQVSIAAASVPYLNLDFQQRRRGMGPQDNVTASINDEAVRQWFGDSDWSPDSVPLDSCPRFPCEVTFEFQERQDTPATSGAVYIDNLAITPDVQPIAAVLPGSRSARSAIR